MEIKDLVELFVEVGGGDLLADAIAKYYVEARSLKEENAHLRATVVSQLGEMQEMRLRLDAENAPGPEVLGLEAELQAALAQVDAQNMSIGQYETQALARDRTISELQQALEAAKATIERISRDLTLARAREARAHKRFTALKAGAPVAEEEEE
jgi:predicted RNase H-like nuclease (RuvC/YqgF family)